MRRIVTVIVGLGLILIGCSDRPRRKYLAAPGFSPEKFSEITIGATLEQALKALGPPLSIFGPIEGSGGFHLTFTGPTSTSLSVAISDAKKTIEWDNYSLKFSRDCLVTQKILRSDYTAIREGLDLSIHANENFRRSIGDLTLTSASGASIVLNTNEFGLYIILLDKDAPSGRCSINNGPSWLQEVMQEKLDDGTLKGVFHVYIGYHPKDYSLLGDSIDGLYTQTEPSIGVTNIDRDNGFLLYRAGILHSLPFVQRIPDEHGDPVPYEVGVFVQKWLINNLGQD